MTRAAQQVARRVVSDAASRIFATLYPAARCPPHEAGAVWLAIRAWVRRTAPRPPIRRFVRRAVSRYAARREPQSRVELRDMPQRPPPPEVPWVGTELRIAEALASGSSYQEVSDQLGISPASVSRRVAAMRRRGEVDRG